MENAIIIAGGAGFIGSNLVRRLSDGRGKIIILDNFSRGSLSVVQKAAPDQNPIIIQCDLSDCKICAKEMEKIAVFYRVTEVWHLAANSDIQAGHMDPNLDLKDTFFTTLNLLTGSKKIGVQTFVFASSSAIYGNLGNARLNEESGPLLPISNYGAMKLASEAIISAACESWLKRSYIFRFPNVVGSPATHGV